jgi:hypothetical protein
MRTIVLPTGKKLTIPSGWDRFTHRDALGRLRSYVACPADRDTTHRWVAQATPVKKGRAAA